MANKFLIKRGDGAPVAGGIDEYELVYDYTNNQLYTKVGSTITAIGAAGVVDSISNFSNNRVLTASDSDSINGEANLTFDGNHLDITNGHLVLPFGEINDSGTDLNIVGTNAITLQSESGTALTIPNASTNVILEGELFLKDGKDLVLGNDSDLQLKFDGSHSYVRNATGDLYFQQHADDKDIVFQSDDGSGGVTAYLTLDGSAGFTKANKHIRFLDGQQVMVGDSADAIFYHDGSNSWLDHSGTGNFHIRNQKDDQDLILSCDDGSGGVTAYLTLDGSATAIKVAKNLELADSVQLRAGSGDDLKIHHDGSNSFIIGAGTGNLIISQQTNDADIILKSDNGSGGTTNYIQLDGSEVETVFNQKIKIEDSKKLCIGTGRDLEIFHDGTNSVINNTTGDLQIYQNLDDKDIVLLCDDGSGGTTPYLTLDGSATKTIADESILIKDTKAVFVGNAGDGSFFHNGTNTFLSNSTGDLIFEQLADDKDIILKSDNGSGGVTPYITLDGSATDIKIAQKMQFPASHSQDKIVMYSGGNEKIGTEANTLLFTADNHKFIDTASSETMQWTSSNNYLTIHETGSSKGSHLRLATDNSDFFLSASGANNQLTIYDANAATNSLVMGSDGKITLRDSLKIPVGKSVFFGGSEHTYIREDIDDRLRFFVGGAEFMRFTESSSDTIQLYKETTVSNLLYISSSNDLPLRVASTDGACGIALSDNSTTGTHNRIVATGNTDMDFFVNNTSRLELNHGNNVNLFRTDSGFISFGPQNSSFAHINTDRDKFYFNKYIVVDGGNVDSYDEDLHLRRASSNDDKIVIHASDTRIFGDADERIRIGSTITAFKPFVFNNNVGIGESSIDANLHVTGSPVVIKMERAGHRAMRMGTPSNSSLFVFADSDNLQSNQRMVIDNSGNVGINNTSPASKLHVDHAGSGLRLTSSADQQIRFDRTSGNSFSIEHDTSRIYLFNRTLGAYNSIAVLNSGFVGINAISPGARFTVRKDGTQASGVSTTYQIQTVSNSNGGIAIQAGASSDALLVFGDNGQYDAGRIRYHNNLHHMDFCTGGNNPRMTIDDAGLVGIKTASPDGQLHVQESGTGHGSGGIITETTTQNGNAGIRFRTNGTDRWAITTIGTNGEKLRIRDSDAGADRINITSNGAFHVTNDVVAFSSTPSDRKLKTNVEDIEYGLDTVMKLKPKQYDWKKDDRHDIGFIAQEVEEVIPEIVKDTEWFDDKIKTMDYEKLTAVLIKAVQEQQQQINELKEKLNG